MGLLKIILEAKMQSPVLFGWFHIMFLFFVVIGSFALCIAIKNAKNKTVRIVLLTFALVLFAFEILKQLHYSYNFATGKWNYAWWVFPFQFCSTPMYVAFFAALCKKNKVQKSLTLFLATYNLFAGISVMLYPSGVYGASTFINIQTMVHHGLQVVIGIAMLTYHRKELTFKSFLLATYTFLVLVAVAMAMNIVAYHSAFVTGTFNMFFISPYYPSSLPVVSLVYKISPYPVFIVSYLVGFMLVALIVQTFAKMVYAMSQKHRAKKQP